MRNIKLIIIISILTSSLVMAEGFMRPRRELLPPQLKGLEWNGRRMKHGLLKWAKRKPFSPMLNSESSKRGEQIYTKHCMECHGANGLGDGPVAKQFNFNPGNLKESAKELTNHYLAFQIEVGKETMPSWIDVLNEEEIWDLTHYLHQLSLEN